MKETMIILCILILIIAGGLGVQKYLNNSSKELLNKLSEIKELSSEENTIDILNQKSDELYNEWKKIEKKWSIIVLHDELDLIEEALIETKENIQEKNLQDRKSSIRKINIFNKSYTRKRKILFKKCVLKLF